MREGVLPISATEMARWSTKRLLGLRDRLLACEEDADASDLDRSHPDRVYFKSDARWRELHAAVKHVLSSREHAPRGDETGAVRRSRAQAARSVERRVRRPR